MGLRAPSELTRDEMFSMLLRMQRELAVAEDCMSEMLREIRSAQEDAQRTANSLGAEDGKKYATAAYYLRQLGGRFNNLPKKLERMRVLNQDLAKDFVSRAEDQWRRVQKFLSLTNLDGIYRDIVTGQEVHSLFRGWEDADVQEADLFNEERLYEALGKDDARTILALHRRFHELRTLRQQIDYEDDAQTPKIDPKDAMYRFRESTLFQKMRDLLSISAHVISKLQPDPKKADKHTAPQQKNLLRRLTDTLEDLDGGSKA